jgi:hypothetical protein
MKSNSSKLWPCLPQPSTSFMWNPNISHGRQNLCSGQETVDVGDPYDAINNKNMEFLVPDADICPEIIRNLVYMSILRQSSWESVLFLSAISDQYRSISNIQLKSFVLYSYYHLLLTLLYWLHSPCFKTLILNRWFMFANTFTIIYIPIL